MNKTIAQQLNIKDFPFRIKDKNGKIIYVEDSTGYCEKFEYDQKGNRIYFEESPGYIEVVELTLDEIAAKLNIDVNLLKIKK